jgi:hypothetical protein
MNRCAAIGRGERPFAGTERAHGCARRKIARPIRCHKSMAWARNCLVMLLFVGCLSLSGCQGDPYESGYRDGYAAGFTNGQEVGYRDGYKTGYSTALPPGDEFSPAAAGWLDFGAASGGVALLLGLTYCLYRLVAQDFTLDVAFAKFAAIVGALLLSILMTSLVGAHRLVAPLLLSGRPTSGVWLLLIVLVTAVPVFVINASLRSVVRFRWGKRQQITIVVTLAFALFFLIAMESLMVEAPQAERYIFCYISLGTLSGMTAHLIFRCTRKVLGW